MKKLMELGDRYAAQSNWKDFALTKFCLCSMGVLIGVNLPKKHKKCATAAAAGIFALTYVPLMARVFSVAKEMAEEEDE